VLKSYHPLDSDSEEARRDRAEELDTAIRFFIVSERAEKLSDSDRNQVVRAIAKVDQAARDFINATVAASKELRELSPFPEDRDAWPVLEKPGTSKVPRSERLDFAEPIDRVARFTAANRDALSQIRNFAWSMIGVHSLRRSFEQPLSTDSLEGADGYTNEHGMLVHRKSSGRHRNAPLDNMVLAAVRLERAGGERATPAHIAGRVAGRAGCEDLAKMRDRVKIALRWARRQAPAGS